MRALDALGALALVTTLQVSLAAQAATPRVVVVVTKAKGAPDLTKQVKVFVQKPLHQTVTQVPSANYLKAAKSMGFRGAKLGSREAATAVGHRIKASHVVTLQVLVDGNSQHQKLAKGKKRRGKFVIKAMVVDTDNGVVLLDRRYPFFDRRFDATLGRTIFLDISNVLQTAASMPEPAAVAAPEPPPAPVAAAPPPPPPALEPPPAPVGPADVPHDQPSDAATLGRELAQAHTEPVAPPANTVDPGVTVGNSNDAYRPALRLAVGLDAYTRTANISTGNSADIPPCYCERGGGTPVVFSKPTLTIELYPFAFGGSGRWWEGLGLHAEAAVGYAKTGLGNGQIVTSTVGGIRGGLQYRLVLWDSTLAGDITVKMGLSNESFPLTGAQFPGTGYRAGYGGLYLTFPLVNAFALQAGGHYLFLVRGFGGTAALGQQNSYGSGYHGEAGVRITLVEALEIRLLGHYDKYTLPFQGGTSLNGSSSQYNNVTLGDKSYGGVVTVGFIY